MPRMSHGDVRSRLKYIPQGQPFLANLRGIASFKQLEITFQRTLVQDLLVSGLVVGGAKEDVIPNRLILYPRLLRSVCNPILARKAEPRARTAGQAVHFTQEGHEQRGFA